MTGFQTHTFAIELGNIRVETLQSVDGMVIGQDVVDDRQVSSSGELIAGRPGAAGAKQITATA
ncbi:hypothetical protein [Streptomyces roseifaciens]|uniref:hypothetical protein n=1 Tax=Streptomyces roseifaciens TaxID=1488406 RepID=UPI000B1157AC|nr:hypothetical protein [Streptomyces roseifaciens]